MFVLHDVVDVDENDEVDADVEAENGVDVVDGIDWRDANVDYATDS